MQLHEFAQSLRGVGERLARASFREPLRQTGEAFGDEVAGNFRRNEDSEGNAWAPHAESTVKRYGPHPLLRLTYAMYQAATDLDNAAAKVVLDDREITIGIDGNEIPYAVFQDEGTAKIPQREFFYLNEESKDKVASVLEDAALGTIVELLP